MTHTDQVVGDDAETDPAPACLLAPIAAAAEPMPPPGHADATLASRSAFLAIAEPAFLLLAPARGTLAGAIGYAYPLDTFHLGRGFTACSPRASMTGNACGR